MFFWKPAKKIKVGGCKVVVVQTPEWKFKTNIAGNATFKGRLGPNFSPIWVKNGKKTDYFQEFHFS